MQKCGICRYRPIGRRASPSVQSLLSNII